MEIPDSKSTNNINNVGATFSNIKSNCMFVMSNGRLLGPTTHYIYMFFVRINIDSIHVRHITLFLTLDSLSDINSVKHIDLIFVRISGT